MSDVERPTPSNSPRPSRITPGAPVRNMADIAKLFLDGARPGNNGAPAPRRVPPLPPAAPVHQAPPAPTPTPRAAASAVPQAAPARRSSIREEAPMREKPLPAPRPLITFPHQSVLMGLALPSADNAGAAWAMLGAAAAGLAAEQGTTVALVGMQNDRSGRPQLVIDVHGAESPEDLPATRPMAGVIDLQLAQALFTLRPAVGLWLIAAPDPLMKGFHAVTSRVGEWLLACPIDNEGLIAAYQHFKKLWVVAQRGQAAQERTPSAFLLADDFAHAAVVHQRMRKAAQEFLKTDLALAGVAPAGAGEDPVRVLTLPASPGAVDSLWACILDELCPTDGSESGHLDLEVELADAPERVPLPTDAESIEDVLEQVSSNAEDLARHSAAAAGMVLDHLAQVLDPEEREALSASFGDEEDEPEFHPHPLRHQPVPPAPRGDRSERADRSPGYDIRSQVIPPAIIEMPAPQARPTPAPKPPATRAATVAPPMPVAAPVAPAPQIAPGTPVGVTLRAFDVLDAHDETRASQWAAVERSVRDLVPGSILLEARPPMSWASESCIAIDPDGRLHVWTLYKDGASWFALREWASEHRNLLALTRRDLILCKEAQVAVHIVLPLDAAPDTGDAESNHPGVVSTILRTPVKNIHLYRLRVLQWNARRGLLVVPIA